MKRHSYTYFALLGAALATLFLFTGCSPDKEKAAARQREQLQRGVLVANELLHADQADRAIAQLERLDQTHPGQPEIVEALAFAYAQKSDHLMAALYFDRAYELMPSQSELALLAAQSHTRAGQPEQSASAYRAYLRNNPTDSASWRKLGEAELELNRNKPALDALLESLRLRSTPATSAESLQLARLYHSLGNQPQALRWYGDVLKHTTATNSEHATALLGQFDISLRQKQWQQAVSIMHRLEKIAPNTLASGPYAQAYNELLRWEKESKAPAPAAATAPTVATASTTAATTAAATASTTAAPTVATATNPAAADTAAIAEKPASTDNKTGTPVSTGETTAAKTENAPASTEGSPADAATTATAATTTANAVPATATTTAAISPAASTQDIGSQPATGINAANTAETSATATTTSAPAATNAAATAVTAGAAPAAATADTAQTVNAAGPASSAEKVATIAEKSTSADAAATPTAPAAQPIAATDQPTTGQSTAATHSAATASSTTAKDSTTTQATGATTTAATATASSAATAANAANTSASPDNASPAAAATAAAATAKTTPAAAADAAVPAQKLYELGNKAFDIKEFEQAIALFEGAVKQEPDNAAFNYQLSRAQFRTGLYKEAEASAEKAIKAKPDNLGYRLEYLRAYQRNHTQQEVLQALLAAKAEFPKEPSVTLALARGYEYIAKNKTLASALYREYLEQAPDSRLKAEIEQRFLEWEM